MRSLLVALVLVFAASVAQAEGTYFWWVTEDGVFSYTDDEKNIPARYKVACALPCKAAEEIVIGPLKDYDRLTISTVTPEPAPARVTVEAPRVETCDGSVTVTSERRQFGEYNRRVYLVHDECGNLVSETLYQPEVQVNR